jgi:hypothetical protein
MVLDYLIWCYATDRGWELTALDIAAGINQSEHAVQRRLATRGWLNRVRKRQSSYLRGLSPAESEKVVEQFRESRVVDH